VSGAHLRCFVTGLTLGEWLTICSTIRGFPWRSSAVRGFVQCGRCAKKKGSSDADVRNFSCKKVRIFWNLLCIRTDKEGTSTDIFRTGEGLIVLCGRLLWTAPLTVFHDFE